jgi:signal-transduction protein with cAMP-binding, CBS, and nucleotidyltransferase domain
MPTNYQSADFSQLYRQFKNEGGTDDLMRLSSLVNLGDDYVFFPNLVEHIGFLDRGCAILDERRDYLKVRYAEVLKLTERIGLATTLEELVELHRRLNVVAVELYLRGIGVMEIHSLITSYRHRLTEKVIAIISEKLAPLPCEFAWFNMGSDGRREQTFFTDQDNALVYMVDGVEEIDAFFESFANEVVAALDQVGFALCSGNIMPSNPHWRGSLAEWGRKMEGIFHDQSQDNLLRVIILMDITYCAGSNSLGQRLIDKVHQMIHDNFGALMVRARSAIMSSVALTMFNKLRLETSGDHRGMFNVKLYGWAPLIMTARVFALKYGLTDNNTIERIKHLEAQNHFESELSLDLQKAYRVLSNAKMVSQVEAIVSGRKYDYYLDPETLKESEQVELKQALGSVEALQKLAYNSFFGSSGL